MVDLKSQTPATISKDEQSMAICAIRYCIGRQTYIVGDGQAWARKYGNASEWVRRIVIQDIESAERFPQGLGADSDRAGWLVVLAELRAMDGVHV